MQQILIPYISENSVVYHGMLESVAKTRFTPESLWWAMPTLYSSFLGVFPPSQVLLQFREGQEALDKRQTPFTPALTLVMGLEVVLRQIEEEGLENIYKRHGRLAEATRTGVKALGLELLAEPPSNVLTAVWVPEGIDGKALVAYLRESLGILFAGGKAHFKGKIFRIDHIGYFDDFDVLVAIVGLERALNAVRYGVKLGAGLAAAQEFLGRN